jgi:hypothetical protein
MNSKIVVIVSNCDLLDGRYGKVERNKREVVSEMIGLSDRGLLVEDHAIAHAMGP